MYCGENYNLLRHTKSGNLKMSLIRDVVWLAQEKSGTLCSPEAYEMILLLSGEIKCAP